MIGSSTPSTIAHPVPGFGQPALVPHQELSAQTPLSEKRAIRVAVAIGLIWVLSFGIGFKTSIFGVTLVGFSLAIYGLRTPIYGVIGISVLCSIDALTRSYIMTGGLFRYNTFNYWLLLVMFILLPIHFRQKDIHTWLMRAFVCLLILELAWSPGVKNGVLHIMNMITVFGIYAYLYRCRQNPRMWYLIAITVGLSSAMAGLAFFFNRDGLSFSSVREEYLINDILDTNYIDPNALCYVFIAAMIGIGMGLASNTTKGIEQTILYLLFAINFCWTFLVGSRGGILVASVCALYVLFSARSTSRRFQMIAAGILGTLFVINAFPQFRDRTFHRVDQLVDQDLTVADRTSNRSDFVIAAWRMTSSSPVGVGTGGFRYSWSHLDDTRGLKKGKLKYEKSSHSAWLKTIAENGFPGIVLFTAFVFSFAFAGLRIGRSDSIALGFLVTAVLSVSFISTQFQSKGLWFMVAAAIVFLYHRRIPAPATPTRSLSQPILHAGQIVKG